MKIKITSDRRLQIEAENIAEEIFIEDVLGLKRDGDLTQLVRVNAHNLLALAYLEAKKKPDEPKCNQEAQ